MNSSRCSRVSATGRYSPKVRAGRCDRRVRRCSLGGVAVAFRRLPTSLRTVDRYHRALDTMGKLAAQQAAPPLDPAKSADHPRLTQPAEPDHSYVRVVRDDTAPAAPPRPPTLRSRPRRPRPPAYPDAVTTPGPNTRIVRVDEPPLTSTPPPGSSPSQLEPGRIERSALGADAPDVTTSASKTAPPARSRHAGPGEAEQGPVLNGQVEHGPVDHGPLDSGPVDNGTTRPPVARRVEDAVLRCRR